jgi:hypothetical protein
VKLADLRRTTVRKSLRIRFQLPNGMECVINEHGIAQIPALRAVPDFDLEGQLEQIRDFVIEPVTPPEKGKIRPQPVTREQLAALAGASGADSHHEEHEE